MLLVEYKTVGVAQENTYAIVNSQKEVLIIDPGAQAEELIQWIDGHQWKPQAILLTHCHFDHIGAIDKIRDYYQIEVYVHELEEAYLSNPLLNLSYGMLGQSVKQRPAENIWYQKDMTDYQINQFKFRIVHLPGHSPGHVVFIFEREGFVIAGDTLFKQSIGRTDLPQGNFEQLIEGIQQQLLSLPETTTIYPGHGSPTTIKAEKQLNPFLIK